MNDYRPFTYGQIDPTPIPQQTQAPKQAYSLDEWWAILPQPLRQELNNLKARTQLDPDDKDEAREYLTRDQAVSMAESMLAGAASEGGEQLVASGKYDKSIDRAYASSYITGRSVQWPADFVIPGEAINQPGQWFAGQGTSTLKNITSTYGQQESPYGPVGTIVSGAVLGQQYEGSEYQVSADGTLELLKTPGGPSLSQSRAAQFGQWMQPPEGMREAGLEQGKEPVFDKQNGVWLLQDIPEKPPMAWNDRVEQLLNQAAAATTEKESTRLLGEAQEKWNFWNQMKPGEKVELSLRLATSPGDYVTYWALARDPNAARTSFEPGQRRIPFPDQLIDTIARQLGLSTSLPEEETKKAMATGVSVEDTPSAKKPVTPTTDTTTTTGEDQPPPVYTEPEMTVHAGAVAPEVSGQLPGIGVEEAGQPATLPMPQGIGVEEAGPLIGTPDLAGTPQATVTAPLPTPLPIPNQVDPSIAQAASQKQEEIAARNEAEQYLAGTETATLPVMEENGSEDPLGTFQRFLESERENAIEPTPMSYAGGGIAGLKGPELAIVGEYGPEMITPMRPGQPIGYKRVDIEPLSQNVNLQKNRTASTRTRTPVARDRWSNEAISAAKQATAQMPHTAATFTPPKTTTTFTPSIIPAEQAALYGGPGGQQKSQSPWPQTQPQLGSGQSQMWQKMYPTLSGKHRERAGTKLPGFGDLTGIRQPRALPSLGAPRFPSAQAWRRMLPSEREAFQRQVEMTGIPLQDYMYQLEQVMPSFGRRGARPGMRASAVRTG